MAAIELKCHVGVGPRVEGMALVTDDNFSARYDLDRIKGIFSRPQHKLAGESYVDTIRVVNTAKGGIASAWMLHEMAAPAWRPRRSCSTASTRSSRKARRSPIWPCVTALPTVM